MNNANSGGEQPRTTRRNSYSVPGNSYISEWYLNVRTDEITITHDKLENILIKSYAKHLWRTAWINPLSLLMTLGLSFATSDFKSSAFGLDASTWRAFFMTVALGAFVWLLWTLFKLMKHWRGSSIDALIDRIKNVHQ
jgi:hypothetical protein